VKESISASMFRGGGKPAIRSGAELSASGVPFTVRSLDNTSGFRRLSMLANLKRNVLRPAGLAVLTAASVTLSAPAHADSVERIWTEGMTQLETCGSALNDTYSAGGRCFLGSSVNRVLDEGTRYASDQGKTVFGPHFQLVGNLTYSPVPGQAGVVGHLDAVIPFAGGDLGTGAQDSGSALFLQQGITRWWDSFSSLHNDMRHGLVYRFRTSDELNADILGISMFHLSNVEQRHEVLVPAIDYMGRWGTASFRYFSPTTGWRTTRAGLTQERAREGMELAMGIDVTSTLRMNTTGYRWQAGDGSRQWTHGVRLDVGWRPHRWLHFTAGYDGMSEGGEALSFLAGLRIPFGSQSKPPRWEGLGLAAGGSAPRTVDLWRPTEGVGQIRVATRTTVDSLVRNAKVRFLQDTVTSGGAVQLEVVLPVAAPQDILVAVRLVSGSGNNPAVPGEDFVDEPVETTISKGARTVRVFVQLLRNESMLGNRNLGATVSVISS